MEFYHVAREPITDSIIELRPISFYLLEKNDTEELRKHHSNGLSSFGEKHLFPSEMALNDKNCKVQIDAEQLYEDIRRIHYQDKPSRYSSFFACRTFVDTKFLVENIFKISYTKQSYKIYKVECQDFQLFDMNLLFNNVSEEDIKVMAHRYWSQKTTKNPFYEVLCKPPVKIINQIKSM